MHKMRELRHKRTWVIQKLAVEAGVSPSTIVMIEKYGYVPGGGMRGRLAEALGVKPEEIWPDTGGEEVADGE